MVCTKKIKKKQKGGKGSGSGAGAGSGSGSKYKLSSMAKKGLDLTRTCIQRGPAGIAMDLQKKTVARIENAVHGFQNGLANGAKEIFNCGTGIPRLMVGIGKGIQESVSATANSIVGDINKVTQALTYVPNPVVPLTRRVLHKIEETQHMLEDINGISTKLMALMTDQRVLKLVGDMSDKYFKGLTKILDAAQPSFDKLVNKMTGMINKVQTRIGDAIGTTGSNVTKSVISVIPGIGGVISLIVSMGELSNKLIKTCTPIVEFGGRLAHPINKVGDEVDNLRCQWRELKAKVKPIMDELDNLTTTKADKKQKGGKLSKASTPSKKKKHIKNKKFSKRIKY